MLESDQTALYQTIQSNPDRAKQLGINVEKFDPEKCRIAGSGSVIGWVSGNLKEFGFIYANLPEAQMLEQLGYRTFFHDLSEERWFYTQLLALPWLYLGCLLSCCSAQ